MSMTFKHVLSKNYRYLIYISYACSAALILFSCSAETAETKEEKTPLIIDADTANEIDDLYAIVRAINEPSFNLIGITSAQFHTSPLATDSTVYESQRMNEEILTLMGREDIPAILGGNEPLAKNTKPNISPAAQFMINAAHKLSEGEKLNIVILGSCTNVAAAVLTDPSIIKKLNILYLGFWHEVETNTYNKKEFNTGNDPLALDTLLNIKELQFSVMTATTSQQLVFTKAEVDAHLKGNGGISEYLVERWETYDRWWTKEDPEKKNWTMWDIAIIEALARPELAKTKSFLTPPENTKREIKIYTEIDVEKMKIDFWQHLSSQ